MTLEALDPGGLIRRKSIRSTLAVLAGCSLCFFWGAPGEVGFTFLSAYLVTLADIPAPAPQRVRLLAATTVLLACAAELGSAVHGHLGVEVALLVPLSFGAVLLGGVLLSSSPLGVYALMIFIVASGLPTPTPGLNGLWVLVGGGLATLATVVLLPLQRDTVSWLRLSSLMRSLAHFLDTTRQRLEVTDADRQAHEAELNGFFNDLRRTLAAAMASGMGTTRAERATHGFARVARRIVSSLSALESVRRGLHDRGISVPLLDEVYVACAAWLRHEADALPAEGDERVPESESSRALDRLMRRLDGALEVAREAVLNPATEQPDEDEFLLSLGLRRLLEGLCTLRDAIDTDRWPSSEEAGDEPLVAEIHGLNWRQRLAACLRTESSVFGHALRMAAACGISLAVTEWLHVERGYWTSLTVALVLQASFSETLHSTMVRALGTIAGALGALALLALHPSSRALMGIELAMVLLANLSLMFGKALVAFFVTILVVAAMASAGTMPAVAVAQARVENTLLGCVIVLFSIFALWPRWSRDRLRLALPRALTALRGFVAGVASDYQARQVTKDTLHRQADAYGRLDDGSHVLRIALREPGVSRGDEDAWLGLLLSANRIYGISSILERHLGQCAAEHDPVMVEHFAQAVCATLDAAVAACTNGTPLGPPPDEEADVRMLRLRLHSWLKSTPHGSAEDVHIRLLLQLRALLWELGRLRTHAETIAKSVAAH